MLKKILAMIAILIVLAVPIWAMQVSVDLLSGSAKTGAGHSAAIDVKIMQSIGARAEVYAGTCAEASVSIK